MYVLENKNLELEEAYSNLKHSQAQMLQSEKMASIGQLAAGVAHEINNPVGYVTSNLGSLKQYIEILFQYIEAQENAVKGLPDNVVEKLRTLKQQLDLDYVFEDIAGLIRESLEGTERVATIVCNLKTFSRIDEAASTMEDLNLCLDNTLNVVWNELKYKVTLQKDYADLPLTLCNPQQLNQVFVNLFINASHAIEKQGEIIIKTWSESGEIHVSISDTGSGMDEQTMKNIFNPFFTTKEVGKGTGLGLSIAYDIVKKHGGRLSVKSQLGKGTTFIMTIPLLETD
ncbi:MAG: GHKL domain-containing protein, partial [Nitrospira sp.]|nr:GHKL domain-containing protein [Nitrospira sp.]